MGHVEKLLTAEDVAGIMRVGKRTAYAYMRQMIHMEKPMRVTEAALRAWIAGRSVAPEEKKRRGVNTGRRRMTVVPEDYRIPRRRA